MRVPACVAPHVPLTVSEVAAVTSLEGWTNKKVKVVGRLRNLDPVNRLAVLESVAEPEGVFQITVNLHTVDSSGVQENDLVSVLGELDVVSGTSSIIAKIIGECNRLSLQQSTSAMECIRRNFPHILK